MTEFSPASITSRSPERIRLDVCVVSLFLALLLTAAAPISLAAQSNSVVRGVVRSESNGAVLPGAVVELVHSAGASAALADARGQYRLTNVPSGRSVVRARHLGHSPLELEVLISGGQDVVLDLSLRVDPVSLERVTVRADATPDDRDPGSAVDRQPSLAMAGTRLLEGSPGLAELGIPDAARGLPGKEPSDPGSVLYVRGAAADLKLVYLDGAPVYAPFPLGGLLEPVTPGALDRAEIYLGGAPARYDGGLSYVMDLRTRPGTTGISASGAVDLLSARLLAEGGHADRIGFLATARGMHPLASAGVFGNSLPYRYEEGLVRTDARIGEAARLSVTGFFNEEAVTMSELQKTDSVIQWGNEAGSARLSGTIGSTSIEATAARGAYSARLPILGTDPLLAEGEARRTRFSLDFERAGRVQIRYGLSFEEQDYRATATAPSSSAPTAVLEGSGRVAGGYAEAGGRVGSRVSLRGGGRLDRFSTTGDPTFAPRFAATWLITERAAMTFAGGVYHQFLRPPDEVLLADTAATELSSIASLSVARASHLTVSLDQDLGDGIRLGIEGFFKDFSNVPGPYEMDANASGVDFWVRRWVGDFTGWVGYSLAWVWSSSPRLDGADFTGRHLISSGLATNLGERTRLDLRFAYGSGLPYSGIALTTDNGFPGAVETKRHAFTANSPAVTSAERGGTETAPLLYTPARPFVRLDAAIAQRWSPRWWGRSVNLEPYVKLLNGLGRRDALFYYFDASRSGGPREIGSLPVLPVVGFTFGF